MDDLLQEMLITGEACGLTTVNEAYHNMEKLISPEELVSLDMVLESYNLYVGKDVVDMPISDALESL